MYWWCAAAFFPGETITCNRRRPCTRACNVKAGRL